MAAYAPITPGKVFQVNDHVETETFDLKLKIDDWEPVDIAAHVAQLANHLGGSILIGAKEERGRIGRFSPISAEEETKVRRRISEAVEQHAVPVPLVEVLPIEQEPGKFLVAVNVPPMIGGVVGVRVRPSKVEVGYGGDAYFFPVRVGVSGGHLTPATMHLHMLPELRRLIVTLNAIECPAECMLPNVDVSRRVLSVTVEERLNRVTFAWAGGTRVACLDALHVPYQDDKGRWIIIPRARP